jgi:hypothetical protein
MIRYLHASAAALLILLSASAVGADTRPLDVERSTLTVRVFKSGLFSALADNHVIRAPIAEGTMSDASPLAVTLKVKAADLRVLDPDLSPSKRAEVQTRMVGREVLDVASYPEITFESTMVGEAGPDRWTVTGQLTIHGKSRTITVPVTRQNGSYRGAVEIKQRDFGIEPISIAGGTVKVKDQLKIEFEIVPR